MTAGPTAFMSSMSSNRIRDDSTEPYILLNGREDLVVGEWGGGVYFLA